MTHPDTGSRRPAPQSPRAPETDWPWLPERYRAPWLEPFEERCLAGLAEDARILDVGGGRRPSLPPARRPEGSLYAVLDTSSAQIEKAGAGAYDEVYVASVTDRLPDL